MEEYNQKRVMSIIGVILTYISLGPVNRSWDLIGSPDFNATSAGLWMAVFTIGFVLGLSVFMKTKKPAK